MKTASNSALAHFIDASPTICLPKVCITFH